MPGEKVREGQWKVVPSRVTPRRVGCGKWRCWVVKNGGWQSEDARRCWVWGGQLEGRMIGGWGGNGSGR